MVTISKIERNMEEVDVVYFKVLSRHLPGEPKKNHKNPRLGWSISSAKFQPSIPEHKVKMIRIETILLCPTQRTPGNANVNKIALC